MKIDIYDEQRLARQLEIQKKKSWDIEKDINWDQGIDLSKSFLPLSNIDSLFTGASKPQLRAISQLMGLIVASTISQLEDVAYRLKVPVWESFLRKHPVNPELYQLGEQFFEEEKKHSRAFNQYIDLFAKEVNIDPIDLKRILPRAHNTSIEKIYTLNSKIGGMAMWWLIAAVEEESILFYHLLNEVKDHVDPLYYNLHRCHFEEEVRHKSYAHMMLEVYNEFSSTPCSYVFKKVDFILAEVLNMTWTFSQLLKVKEFKKFRHHHEFFNTLESSLDLLKGKSQLDILGALFTSTPYITHTIHLSEHGHINALLNRYSTTRLPMPKSKLGEIKCTV
ncbi:diiron oxygenase [Halobacteriovorax marinus]|uniref:diiron oxygenase n=1 Tax=Halobacteriovorax marinus TaxID=97084 RepID=UPI003A8FB65B